MLRDMRLRLLFALLSLLTLPLSAQRPAWGKMSALVREACRTAQNAPAAPSTRAMQHGPKTIVAFVKLDTPDATMLEREGCKVLAQYGRLFVAEIPLSRLATLSRNPWLQRIEAGRRATALMDTTGIVVGAPQVYEGLNLPQSYTGKGVVVGVMDIGFDLTHPTFYSQDFSRYRIQALWDQLSTDTIGSSFPAGRDYVGRETLLRLGRPRDGDIQTHGTHTAGIAAGSGAEGPGKLSPYRGIAYESDLALVCNATTDDAQLIDTADYYKYTYALDALGFKYIFDYARAQGKPCVINFSEGSHQDLRGDDRLYYEMLDSLTGPGRIIVASAGNDGANLSYLSAQPGQQAVGTFVGGTGQAVGWTTASSGNFGLRLRFYSGTEVAAEKTLRLADVLTTADSTLTDSITVAGHTYHFEATAYPSAYDPQTVACDWSVTIDGGQIDQGAPLSLSIVEAAAPVELYRMRGYFYTRDLDPTLSQALSTHTIHSPGSAPSVICVGATGYRTQFTNVFGNLMVYNNGTHGQRTPFSSIGPTMDGRIKPDVMAPGQNIVSAYSSFFRANPDKAQAAVTSDVRYFDYGGRRYVWNSDAGTSMSAPVVTGVIALWLQADPTLTPARCLDIIARTSHHYDPSLSYPNNLYGYGEIDAYEGLKLVLEQVAAGISTMPAPTSSSPRIYAIDGRYVGTDATTLPPGLYIRQGKKFVVGR